MLLTVFSISVASPVEIPYASIEKAFESNDAQQVVNLGKDKMIINVNGKEGVYSHAQAQQVLKDFFSKSPCQSFDFSFKGKESGDGSFAIGNFGSKSGLYRITMQFKKVGSEYKIESLLIEKA